MRLLSFGHGYSAQALTKRLLPSGWQVIGTTRSKQKLKDLEKKGGEYRVWPDSCLSADINSATHVLISIAPGKNGAHIGIATDIEINNEGKKNPVYKNKKLKFTSPAFNYDEVCEMPDGATLLSSDKVNKVMGLYFRSGKSEIWGLQYHPDYEYWQMLNLSNGRKDRILQNNHFDNENDFQNHLNYIKEEDKKLDFENRTCEIRNWLNYLIQEKSK